MKNRKIVLDKKDFNFLNDILYYKLHDNDVVTRESIKKLSIEMQLANVVDDGNLNENIVRINSKVTILIDNLKTVTIQIVKPADKDIDSNKISILTPMGLALLGYAKGDVVKWNFPNGERKIKIVDVEYVQEKNMKKVA